MRHLFFILAAVACLGVSSAGQPPAKQEKVDPDVRFFQTFEAALARIEKWEKREAALRMHVAENPRDSTAIVQWGDALAQLLRRNDALQAYAQALRVDPQATPARRGAGRVYQQQGEYGRARRQFLEALKINSKDHESLEHLVQIGHAMGRSEEADIYRHRLLHLLTQRDDKPNPSPADQFCREEFALDSFKIKVIEMVRHKPDSAKIVFEGYNPSGYRKLFQLVLLAPPANGDGPWRLVEEKTSQKRMVARFAGEPHYSTLRQTALTAMKKLKNFEPPKPTPQR